MIMDFDNFTVQLFEESKALYEKAKATSDDFSKDTFLHSSLLLVMSSLEACVNSISEELLIDPYKDDYSLLEQSLLLEKDITYKNGCYQLGTSLKMSRLVDKIEFLMVKFLRDKWDSNVTWFVQLKQGIDYRNRLVHPKEYIKITEKQVEVTITSVLKTMNALFKAVYKKQFPSYSYELTSRYDIT